MDAEGLYPSNLELRHTDNLFDSIDPYKKKTIASWCIYGNDQLLAEWWGVCPVQSLSVIRSERSDLESDSIFGRDGFRN